MPAKVLATHARIKPQHLGQSGASTNKTRTATTEMLRAAIVVASRVGVFAAVMWAIFR